MKKLSIILVLVFMTATTGLIAQNLNAAGKSYNKGIELAQAGDIAGAVESYEKCAEICAELGDVGEGLKVKSETQICNLYMNMGIEKFKAKKYDSAIILFTESDKYAKLIEDPETSKKLNNYFAASYTGQGNAFYKTTKFAKAVENYNKALEFSPEYPNAYYGLVLAYSKLNDSGMMEESIKKLEEYSSNEDLKKKANLAGGKYFLKECAKALQKEEFNIASMSANKSIEYNNQNPKAFYYLALASNSKQDWVSAQKAALKAISFEDEHSSDYYFVLGQAYEGAGENEKACDAYANVATGPNKEVASYQRTTVLKCN